MFDKLDDLLVRFEELLNELGEPGVTDDPAHFQKLMKEQSDLQPIVDAYKEYKKNCNNYVMYDDNVELYSVCSGRNGIPGKGTERKSRRDGNCSNRDAQWGRRRRI